MPDMIPKKDPVTGIISFVKELPMVTVNTIEAAKILAEPVSAPVDVQPTIQNSPLDKDDVAGVDYDPYGKVDAGGYNQFTDIHNPNIPFHNYRQIHVTIDALFKGYNSTRPLPVAPPLWGDVGHYWSFGVLVGYGAYELIRVFGGIVVAAITLYFASKGIVA